MKTKELGPWTPMGTAKGANTCGKWRLRRVAHVHERRLPKKTLTRQSHVDRKERAWISVSAPVRFADHRQQKAV